MFNTTQKKSASKGWMKRPTLRAPEPPSADAEVLALGGGDHYNYPTTAEWTAYSPEYDLTAPVDQMLMACGRTREQPYFPPERQGKPGSSKFYIYPSSAGKCLRALLYQVVKARKDPDEPDGRMQRIFGNGHAVHRRIQGYFFECWRRRIGGVTRVWENVKFRHHGARISGELDFIVEFLGGHRIVVEIKSMKHERIIELTKPQEEWVAQAYIYMLATGIATSCILVEDKNDQTWRTFYIHWDPAVWEKMADDYGSIFDIHIPCGSLPDMDKRHCFFCNYKGVCGQGPRGVDWDKIPKKLPIIDL